MTTLVHKLMHWADVQPETPALYRRNPSGWEAVTWAEYLRAVEAVGDSLVALGVEPGDCVTIVSQNRVKWLVAQFGAGSCGAAVAPCYPTCTAAQIAYQIAHSHAPVVFVEDAHQLDKLIQVRDELPLVRRVVLFDATGAEQALQELDGWAQAFEGFLALGAGSSTERRRRFEAIEPQDLALVIYTSGTTGVPKGVMLSHANLCAMGPAVLERYQFGRTRAVSYLPLCHVGEQTATNIAQLETGGEVYLCSDPVLVKEFLPEVQPTVFFGVPRIWEKVESALTEAFASMPLPRRLLVRWAMATEAAAHGSELRSRRRELAHRWVLAKIRRRLGLGELEFALTGAAPPRTETLRFFASLGVHIHQVYGLSETAGVLTATEPRDPVLGTVGTPIEGAEVRIADDGEILCRGPGITCGYLHAPEATAELFEDGWLKSGDLGRLDDQGRLLITGRKKDLLITAGAKNVAPQPIEAQLAAIPGISHAVVIGDGRPYLIALLTLDDLAARRMTARFGVEGRPLEDLVATTGFQDYIAGEVGRINDGLARYETIKRYRVLPQSLSQDADELTPTLKVKRNVVVSKHRDLIDEIYGLIE